MFAQSFWMASLLVLVAFQPGGEEKAKKDLEFMQGTWELHALEINGKTLSLDQLAGLVLVVKKDVYKTTLKDQTLFTFRIQLDPGKNPRAIDMTMEKDGTETTVKAIYVIENGMLKICRPVRGDQERPTQFATWPDTDYLVATWKKQK
jgi:uncharacterized protein (TIGR03067 family)